MSTTTLPGATTIVELRDDEIEAIADALSATTTTAHIALADRLARGDHYYNEADEYARLTLRDRRLKAERSRINARLHALEEPILERMAEDGLSAIKHDGTGKTISRDDKLWAKYQYDGDKPSDDDKARAARALKAAGLDQYVYPTFNTNSVSAYFRADWKAIKAANDELPEHERKPLPDPNDVLLSEEMRDAWHLDVTPTLVVR